MKEKEKIWADILFEAFCRFYDTTCGCINILKKEVLDWSKLPDGLIDYHVEVSSGILKGTDIIRVQINSLKDSYFRINPTELTDKSVVLHFQNLESGDARFILMTRQIIESRKIYKIEGPLLRYTIVSFKFNRKKLELGAWYPMVTRPHFRAAAKLVGGLSRDKRSKAKNKLWS